MKILLAADGSEYTKRAAKYLVEHLSMFREMPEVHVLNVHPPIPYKGAASVVGRKAVEKYQREECEEAIAVGGKPLRKADIPFKAEWRVGDVAEEIQAYVKKNGIELIVMGSHGHTAFGNLAMGSVATKVIATVKVPVMIVR